MDEYKGILMTPMEFFIRKLNTQIAMIDSDTIQEHIDKGDLEKWICDWRIETAAVVLGLFAKVGGTDG